MTTTYDHATWMDAQRQRHQTLWHKAYVDRETAPAKTRKPYIPAAHPSVDMILDAPDRDLMLRMGVPPAFALPRKYPPTKTVRNWLLSLPYIYRPTVERQNEKPGLYGHGLLFYGPSGTGKTTEAAALLLDLVRLDIRSTDPDLHARAWHGRSMGMFADWQEASAQFRAAAGGSADADEYRLRLLGQAAPSNRADFLVLDDISRERTTIFNSEQLHRILRYRKNNGLATILTTNHPPEDWEPFYGDVLAAYLSRSFTAVKFPEA